MQIIADLLDDQKAKAAALDYIDQQASRGRCSICVADSFDGGDEWVLLGLISLLDPPREDSAATIKRAQDLGVQVTISSTKRLLLTGLTAPKH